MTLSWCLTCGREPHNHACRAMAAHFSNRHACHTRGRRPTPCTYRAGTRQPQPSRLTTGSSTKPSDTSVEASNPASASLATTASSVVMLARRHHLQRPQRTAAAYLVVATLTTRLHIDPSLWLQDPGTEVPDLAGNIGFRERRGNPHENEERTPRCLPCEL